MSEYDQWRKERDCGSKRRYTQSAAIRRAREPYPDGKPRRAYRCPFCAHWHVGGTRGFDERERSEWTGG